MAEHQTTSEPATSPMALALPSKRPTMGGKTVDEDYYKALERQAEKYQKQEEASEDEGQAAAESTTVIPLDRLFDDDELDAVDGDVASSDPAAKTTSSPISTPDYFFEDDDETVPSSPPAGHIPTSPKTTKASTDATTPPAPSQSGGDIEEDFDWYQYPARPGESEGLWTPQYAHARRAPRIKGKTVTIRVERSKTFFSFPPEVRQRIYKYALFPKGIEGHGPRPYFSQNSTWKVKTPALLRTSFDVRREAIPYYYNEIRMACSEPIFAKMWLSKIGKEARLALGGVKVRFDEKDKRNKTEEQQRLRFFQAFRAAGVEVRKDIIAVR